VKISYLNCDHRLSWNRLPITLCKRFRAGVPKLGYICLSEGVHLKLAIEGKICLYIIHSQLFISVNVMSTRRNFSKGDNVAIFFTLFRVLTVQCKWMFTMHFTLFTTQRKCPMLWQQWKEMRFVGSHSQVYYDNCFHHRLSADFQNRALLFTEVAYCYYD